MSGAWTTRLAPTQGRGVNHAGRGSPPPAEGVGAADNTYLITRDNGLITLYIYVVGVTKMQRSVQTTTYRLCEVLLYMCIYVYIYIYIYIYIYVCRG